jgi:hypothetical protein
VVKPLGPGFLPLQDALEKARPGDVVLVEPGRYAERVEIPNGVTLRGVAGPARTFVCGDGTGSTLLVRAADSLVVIEGFTFTGGGTTFVTDRGLGGGGAILCDESNVTIRDNVFRGNRPTDLRAVGGAVAIFGGHVSVENNLFEDNAADKGGGLYVGGNARVTGNRFVRNVAARYGGGLYVERAVALVERNIFRLNDAGWGGGAAVGHLTSATARRNTFLENHCRQWGGGMFVLECEPQVERNLFVNNKSDFRGGGFAGGAFAFPVLKDNLGYGNQIHPPAPSDFYFVEDTLDIPGSSGQLRTDPQLVDLVRGDLHPLRGGAAAGARGVIGALDPIEKPIRPRR